MDTDAIHLGFFSFNKLLIYKDLATPSWPEENPPHDHAIIRNLFGVQGFEEPGSSIADDDHLDDRLDVSDTHQVVDSDSSQTLAVIDAKSGRNVVIQGPPGTGKSQTITNLIAEALADDRTVLFVAEKMAALEVVKRRLDNIHIGDACLELHSHKANKRAVLDELKRTLNLGKPRLSDPAEDRAQLRTDRTRLNDYCRLVNTPIGDSGVSPHDIVGRLAQLEESAPSRYPSIRLDGASQWSHAEFTRRRELVEALQGVGRRHRSAGRTHLLDQRQAVTVTDGTLGRSPRRSKMRQDAANEFRTALDDLRTASPHRHRHRTAWRPWKYCSGRRFVRPTRPTSTASTTGTRFGLPHADALGTGRPGSHDAHRTSRGVRPSTDSRRLGGRCRTLSPARSCVGRQMVALRLSGTTAGPAMDCESSAKARLPDDGAAQVAIIEAILESHRLRATVDKSHDLLLASASRCGYSDGDSSSRRALAATACWLIELHADKADLCPRRLHSRDAGSLRLDRTALTGRTDPLSRNPGSVLPKHSPPYPSNSRYGATDSPTELALADRSFSYLTEWLQRAGEDLDALSEIVRFKPAGISARGGRTRRSGRDCPVLEGRRRAPHCAHRAHLAYGADRDGVP